MKDILTCHSRKGKGVNNKINDFMSFIQLLPFQGPGVTHAGSLSRYHGLLGHIKRTEPPLMSLVTSVLFVL